MIAVPCDRHILPCHKGTQSDIYWEGAAISPCSFKQRTPPVKFTCWAWCHTQMKCRSKDRVSLARLLSLSSFLSCWRGWLSLFPSCFPSLPQKHSSLGSPRISPKSPLWRWKNIIWAQFPDCLPLSLCLSAMGLQRPTLVAQCIPQHIFHWTPSRL